MVMSQISVLFQWYAKTHDCAFITVYQVNHIRQIQCQRINRESESSPSYRTKRGLGGSEGNSIYINN